MCEICNYRAMRKLKKKERELHEDEGLETEGTSIPLGMSSRLLDVVSSTPACCMDCTRLSFIGTVISSSKFSISAFRIPQKMFL